MEESATRRKSDAAELGEWATVQLHVRRNCHVKRQSENPKQKGWRVQSETLWCGRACSIRRRSLSTLIWLLSRLDRAELASCWSTRRGRPLWLRFSHCRPTWTGRTTRTHMAWRRVDAPLLPAKDVVPGAEKRRALRCRQAQRRREGAEAWAEQESSTSRF